MEGWRRVWRRRCSRPTSTSRSGYRTRWWRSPRAMAQLTWARCGLRRKATSFRVEGFPWSWRKGQRHWRRPRRGWWRRTRRVDSARARRPRDSRRDAGATAMSRYVSYRDFDWLLLVFVLMICGLGVMEIRSATMHTKFAGSHIKQVYWVLAGVGMMFLISLVNYQALLDRIHWFYIAAIASLMAVMIFGQKYLGAKRWIKMPGGNHFQPSEWVKLILILAMAKFFADLRHRELSWPDFMKGGAIVVIPMLLVLKQPDLGTALTYIPIAVMGVFLGGMQWKQGLAVSLVAGVAVGEVFFVPQVHVLKSYQKQRLTSYQHPEDDPQGSGYQVEQSKIAVGSGGLWNEEHTAEL